MTLTRRFIALGLPALLFARPAIAHHGWRWTDDGRFELRGLITEARLGNPHGARSGLQPFPSPARPLPPVPRWR